MRGGEREVDCGHLISWPFSHHVFRIDTTGEWTWSSSLSIVPLAAWAVSWPDVFWSVISLVFWRDQCLPKRRYCCRYVNLETYRRRNPLTVSFCVVVKCRWMMYQWYRQAILRASTIHFPGTSPERSPGGGVCKGINVDVYKRVLKQKSGDKSHREFSWFDTSIEYWFIKWRWTFRTRNV